MSKERLVKLLGNAPIGVNGITLLDKHEPKAIEEIADYLLANGVIVPPCKVGDTVWSAFWSVRSHKVTRIEITESELNVATNDYRFNFSDFGRIVFLTREEAEAKLKERESE